MFVMMIMMFAVNGATVYRLGRSWDLNENIVIMKHGVSNPRYIRRVVIEGRWKLEMVENVMMQSWEEVLE